MIQIHGNTILSMGFNPIIKTHDSNPCQIIYQNPNFHWQHQKHNSYWQHQKAQFSLEILKSPIFVDNIKKPRSHWQYQKPNLH